MALAMKINSNISALVVQNKKQKNTNNLTTAMERLSSGLRINSAKDDAAGLAIANRFTAQQKGSLQAARNANDGISLSQTTQGYLDGINERLQRVRELSVQGLTGSYSPEDKDEIQTEINLNFKEIERLNEIANFNGIPLLNGQGGAINLQTGANDGNQLKVDLGPPGFNIKELNLVDFTIQGDSAKTLMPVSVFSGKTSRVPLYDDNSSVTYRRSGSEINNVMLVKRTIGSSNLLQETTNNNRLFNVSSGSHHDTNSLENKIDIYQGSNYEDSLRGDSLSISNGAFIDENDTELSLPNQRLVNIQGTYYVRTADDAKNGPFTYYEADIDYSIANNSSTARINRIQLVDGTPKSQEDLGTTYIGDSGDSRVGLRYVPATQNIHNIGSTVIEMDGNPVDEDLHKLVNLNGQYFIEKKVDGADYEYYRASVSVKNHRAANQEILVSSTTSTPLLQVKKEDFVTGISTIHLIPQNKNIQVDYVNRFGHKETDVMRADTYGDYEFHLGSISDDGTPYKRATVVQDTAGQYYLKTIDRGDAELYLYYPVTVEALNTDNGKTVVNDNHTIITFTETDEIVRFRTPEDPLATLDRAIARVDAKRSQFGALDNRLEAVITQQSAHSTQLAAAKSRIEDADYAIEVSNMTRAQILQQASTSVLAQANQIPQTVLSLLN